MGAATSQSRLLTASKVEKKRFIIARLCDVQHGGYALAVLRRPQCRDVSIQSQLLADSNRLPVRKFKSLYGILRAALGRSCQDLPSLPASCMYPCNVAAPANFP